MPRSVTSLTCAHAARRPDASGRPAVPSVLVFLPVDAAPPPSESRTPHTSPHPAVPPQADSAPLPTCPPGPHALHGKKYVGGRTGLWQAGTSGEPCCPAASGRTAEGGCRPALENDGHPAGQVAGTPHGRALATPQLRVPKTMKSSDGYSPSCSAKSLQTPATPSVSLIIHKTSKEAERLACDKGPEFIPGAAPVGTSAGVKAEESEVLTKIKFALSFFFNHRAPSPLFSA